jgi:hypothetical protein
MSNDSPLTSEQVRAALMASTPLGRLERHERTLAGQVETLRQDDRYGEVIQRYELFIRRARSRFNKGDYQEMRVQLAKADAELTALRWLLDPDTIRGEKGSKSSSQGGGARSAMYAPNRAAVLTAMHNLLDRHPEGTPSWAAQRVFKKGVGTSPEANRKIWTKNRKK